MIKMTKIKRVSNIVTAHAEPEGEIPFDIMVDIDKCIIIESSVPYKDNPLDIGSVLAKLCNLAIEHGDRLPKSYDIITH